MKASIKLLSPILPRLRTGKTSRVRQGSKQAVPFRAALEKLWQGLLARMTVEQELQVWQHRDQWGTIHWHAYDPLTQTSISLNSEDEMRSWIERHYYTHR